MNDPVVMFGPLAAFLGSYLVIALILKREWARWALDRPNRRSLHSVPVPRTGGLALAAGIAVGLGFTGIEGLWSIVVPALTLFLVSLADDFWNLPAAWRFLFHLGASATCVYLTVNGQGLGVMVLATFAVAWMTNLYNFMDGSDGFAGGMTAIGFGCYAVTAMLHGRPDLGWASLVVVGSALAFLRFNFHPARIFMGDSGSIPLGFLAGAMGILGWQEALWTWWFPIVVFGPFIVDSTVTLFTRLCRLEKPWEAHREHYYQQLVQAGFGHRNTALAGYFLMILSGTLALWGSQSPDARAHWVVGVLVLIYGGSAVAIRRRYRRHRATRAATGG